MRNFVVDGLVELIAIVLAVAFGAALYFMPPLVTAIAGGAFAYWWLKK